MPTKPKKTAPVGDDSKYLKFLSALKLIGLGLKSSSTMLDRGLLWELTKKEQKQAHRLTESYETTEIGEDFFEAEAQYGVTVADGDRVALKIECTFGVHMHARSPIEPEMAKRFAKLDLRFVLLPYARHFVTDMTSQMQIPPVILPLATAAGRARVGKAPKEE